MFLKTFILTLLSLNCAIAYSQTRSEVTKELGNIIKNSSYADELQYYNNTVSTDCSTLSFSFDTFQSVTFERSEKYARIENTYKNIPWKNLGFITQEKISSSVYLFFNVPITQTRKLIYGPYFRAQHNDGVIERTVRSIQLHILKKNLAQFERLCMRLKYIDSSLTEKEKIPPIQKLPFVSYYQKTPPPTKDQVLGIFDDLVSFNKCEPHGWPSYWCSLSELAGVDISKMNTEELKNNSAMIKEYWNRYCYSFSYPGSIGYPWNSETTILESSKSAGDNLAFGFIAYRIKGNGSFLNPFTGKSYFDNLSADYGKVEHAVNYKDEIINNEWQLLENTNKKYGGQPASQMLLRYKYDVTAHNELIEAIVCNSQGDGIFAGLRNDPAQYLLFMFNIGIRTFDEAVFLFEHLNKVTIPSIDKAQLRASIKGVNLAWD